MRKFAIRNERVGEKDIAYLFYDEVSREYEIDVPEMTEAREAPCIISDFIEKGTRKIDKKWSLRWVQERVTPPNRQNIGQILRVNGMKEYDEFLFLLKSEGRSCQDDCYIVEVKA